MSWVLPYLHKKFQAPCYIWQLCVLCCSSSQIPQLQTSENDKTKHWDAWVNSNFILFVCFDRMSRLLYSLYSYPWQLTNFTRFLLMAFFAFGRLRPKTTIPTHEAFQSGFIIVTTFSCNIWGLPLLTCKCKVDAVLSIQNCVLWVSESLTLQEDYGEQDYEPGQPNLHSMTTLLPEFLVGEIMWLLCNRNSRKENATTSVDLHRLQCVDNLDGLSFE